MTEEKLLEVSKYIDKLVSDNKYIESLIELEKIIKKIDLQPSLNQMFKGPMYRTKALVHSILKDPPSVISSSTAALEYIDMNDSDSLSTLYHIRGKAYFYMSNYNLSISDVSKSININPNVSEHYTIRGMSYFGLHSYNSAILDFNKAISLNPKDGDAYLNRGMVWIHKDNYRDAKRDIEKAKSLGLDVDAFNPSINEYFNSKKTGIGFVGKFLLSILVYILVNVTIILFVPPLWVFIEQWYWWLIMAPILSWQAVKMITQ